MENVYIQNAIGRAFFHFIRGEKPIFAQIVDTLIQ